MRHVLTSGRPAAVTVIAVSLALAACSSDGGQEPDETGPVVLDFWSNLTVPAQAEVIEAQVDDCAADLDGVTVEFETVATDAMLTRLTTAFESDNPPNLMNTNEDAMAFAQARGQLVPVDDLIDSIGRNEFMPAHLHVMTRDDRTWGVPDWALHNAVWYRTDLFEQANLNIPRSWDELLAAADTLTDEDVYGFPIPMSGSAEVATQTYFQFLYSAGVYIFDPETGDYYFGDHLAEATAALEFMLDLYQRTSPPASIDWTHQDYRTAFVEGRTAMTNEWGAVVLQADEQNPELLGEISVFPFPGPDPDRGPTAALGGGYYYAVGDTSDREVAASKELLECMYAVDLVAQRANSRPIFALPATESAFRSPTYTENEFVQQFEGELETIRTDVLDHWYRPGLEAGLNPITGQLASTEFFSTAIQGAAMGQISPRDAVEQIDQNLRSILDQVQ